MRTTPRPRSRMRIQRMRGSEQACVFSAILRRRRHDSDRGVDRRDGWGQHPGGNTEQESGHGGQAQQLGLQLFVLRCCSSCQQDFASSWGKACWRCHVRGDGPHRCHFHDYRCGGNAGGVCRVQQDIGIQAQALSPERGVGQKDKLAVAQVSQSHMGSQRLRQGLAQLPVERVQLHGTLDQVAGIAGQRRRQGGAVRWFWRLHGQSIRGCVDECHHRIEIFAGAEETLLA